MEDNGFDVQAQDIQLQVSIEIYVSGHFTMYTDRFKMSMPVLLSYHGWSDIFNCKLYMLWQNLLIQLNSLSIIIFEYNLQLNTKNHIYTHFNIRLEEISIKYNNRLST